MRAREPFRHSADMTDVLPTTHLSPPPPVRAESEPPSVVSSLLSISKSTRAFLSLFLAEIGLHPGQDQLLDRLEFGRPVSVSVLAEQLAVRPSTVSKMLDRLIEKGFVQRINSDGDARRTMVLLTEAGEKMRLGIHAAWQRLDGELAGGLTPEEHASLALALAKAEAILSTRLRRLR